MKHYPAKISLRFWALVIDQALLFFMYIFLIVSISSFFDIFPEWLQITIGFLLVCLYIFYEPIMETFNHGQTIGKKLFGLRVVRTDGSPASGVNCLQRFLMMPLDSGTLVGGLLCATITEKRQRLGDLVADTMVVVDKPQKASYPILAACYNTELTEAERTIYRDIDDPTYLSQLSDPLILAKRHRTIECTLAQLRTTKGHPALIDHLERELSSTHQHLFRQKAHTLTDLCAVTLKSIPRAVYESRWCIIASLAVCILAALIGVYSQCVDPDFFRDFMGERYTNITIDNINNGNPMGIYSSQEPVSMFFEIFLNNLLVTLQLYFMGVFIIIGPLFMLLNNFVMMGTFLTFFAQHGHLAEAIIAVHQHGTLELWSIVMAGGAAFRLGTGWLFPGRLSRWKALARTARQSMLILISTIPMLLVAAFIEGFITRHTEWPVSIRLAIILVSAIFIILYYVMLPYLAKAR